MYLPLLWEQSFCWKSPIALGYTRGHFSALVAMENDGFDNRGAGANLNTDDDVTVTFLPLVDSERKLLHIHFLSAQEVRHSTDVVFFYFIKWLHYAHLQVQEKTVRTDVACMLSIFLFSFSPAFRNYKINCLYCI